MVRTATLQSVMLRAWTRAGNDGSDVASIPATARIMMAAALNERIAQAWEFAEWPELVRTEERTVQGSPATGFYLEYAQAGETAMGEVFRVSSEDPATHAAPRAVGFRLGEDAVVFGPDTPAVVWVTYRLRPSPRSVDATDARDEWSADFLDDLVPRVLSHAAGLYLTADLLAEDGQVDKAAYYEAAAENELIRQQDKVVFQQGQFRRWRVQGE